MAAVLTVSYDKLRTAAMGFSTILKLSLQYFFLVILQNVSSEPFRVQDQF